MNLEDSNTNDHALRYLDAVHVDGPLAEFASLDLLGPNEEKLGSVEGVLVNPQKRRAEYLVIARRKGIRRRRYVLPMSEIRVDADRHALSLESSDAADALSEFDASQYPEFSDEDVITAMFASQPAA